MEFKLLKIKDLKVQYMYRLLGIDMENMGGEPITLQIAEKHDYYSTDVLIHSTSWRLEPESAQKLTENINSQN